MEVSRITKIGAYLDGETMGEILLPSRYITHEIAPGDTIEVFIYFDSEDRVIATTEKSYAQVDEFAYLRVKAVNKFGAFLDWGLSKDLLVPIANQKALLKTGQWCLVYVYFDAVSGRIAASAKLDKFVDNNYPDYRSGDEVEIIIVQKTDLGYKAIINHLHWGMLYKDEVFRTLKCGDRLKAFVRKIREDEKIDLTLMKDGYEKIEKIAEDILGQLDRNNGYLEITDRSEPEEIYRLFGISKKNFKKAIGNLYRQKLVEISPNGIKRLKAGK